MLGFRVGMLELLRRLSRWLGEEVFDFWKMAGSEGGAEKINGNACLLSGSILERRVYRRTGMSTQKLPMGDIYLFRG